MQIYQKVSPQLDVLLWASVEDDSVPPAAGTVRGEILPSGFVVQSGQDSGICCVTHVCCVDLKGWSIAGGIPGPAEGIAERSPCESRTAPLESSNPMDGKAAASSGHYGRRRRR